MVLFLNFLSSQLQHFFFFLTVFCQHIFRASTLALFCWSTVIKCHRRRRSILAFFSDCWFRRYELLFKMFQICERTLPSPQLCGWISEMWVLKKTVHSASENVCLRKFQNKYSSFQKSSSKISAPFADICSPVFWKSFTRCQNWKTN